MNVYVPNKSGHDFSAAESYGNLVFVSEGYIKRNNVAEMYRLCAEAINNSSETDYIIQTGLPTLFGILCASFAFKHGRLNLLLHEVNTEMPHGRYIERQLVLDQLVDSSYIANQLKR